MTYTFRSTIAGLPGLRRAPRCFGSGYSADSFCFCDWKPRLGSAEDPQPGVDLINMVAPAWSLAHLTVSTPKFEGLSNVIARILNKGQFVQQWDSVSLLDPVVYFSKLSNFEMTTIRNIPKIWCYMTIVWHINNVYMTILWHIPDLYINMMYIWQ